MAKSFGRFAGAMIIALAAVATVAEETFHFPDFVAIERNEMPACGGWIVDKPFRRYVLATERCTPPDGDVRELLVRHGSARVTWRTLSSGVDRMLYHRGATADDRLVVLSTFGKFRRHRTTHEEDQQHHNGTVLLSWARTAQGVLEKRALLLAEDQEGQAAKLASELVCKGTGFLLEGAMILRNLQPYAMLSVSASASFSTGCEATVELLPLGQLTGGEWSVSALQESPRAETGQTAGWFEQANSPFGYIVYTIFLAYSMLYTMFYFILAVGKPPQASSDL